MGSLSFPRLESCHSFSCFIHALVRRVQCGKGGLSLGRVERSLKPAPSCPARMWLQLQGGEKWYFVSASSIQAQKTTAHRSESINSFILKH